MSYITISKAAKLLNVSTKTLFRWDKESRFQPNKREEVSGFRLYMEEDVKNLQIVLDHENRYQKNIKEWKQTLNELTQDKSLLLSNRYIELSDKEEVLRKKHNDLMKEFKSYSPKVHLMHKKFFKI